MKDKELVAVLSVGASTEEDPDLILFSCSILSDGLSECAHQCKASILEEAARFLSLRILGHESPLLFLDVITYDVVEEPQSIRTSVDKDELVIDDCAGMGCQS